MEINIERKNFTSEAATSHMRKPLVSIMKKLTLIFAAFVFTSCSKLEDKDWTKETPTFEHFKTTSFCNVTAVETRPNLLNTEFTIEEKRKIKDAYLDPDSYFHCEYSIASFLEDDTKWCHVIVHAPSGQVIHTLASTNGIIFSRASSLIIVNPIDKEGNTDERSEFWILEEKKMQRIK